MTDSSMSRLNKLFKYNMTKAIHAELYEWGEKIGKVISGVVVYVVYGGGQ
jgi:hypothetical protein